MIRNLDLQRIVKEKNIWASLSDRNREIAALLSDELLGSLITAHIEQLNDLWETKADLRYIEYEMVSRIAMIEGSDYDRARLIVDGFSNDLSSIMDIQFTIETLKKILFKEQKDVLRRFLIDECDVSQSKLDEVLSGIDNLDELRLAAESISQHHRDASSVDFGERIANWERIVEALARRFFFTFDMERKLETDISNSLYEDVKMKVIHDTVEKEDLHQLIEFIFIRTSKVPRLKELSKPTIVLIGGTSGTGKSTISQHITRTLNIPIYSSTDVIAREVVREIMLWMLGNENARDAFPQLFGSSFEGSDLSWYYSHSMLTMIGLIGVIDGIVKDGTSAVIEGVPLIPGTLPDRFYEMANIVWMVSSIRDQDVHFERYAGRDKAGVSRGGAERYRRRFEDIRRIHDRLSDLADAGGALKLDNTGSLQDTLSFALDRVKDPFSDKGLMIKDDLRDRTSFDLSKKRTLLRFDVERQIEQPIHDRHHSLPEIGGPSLADIKDTLDLWIDHHDRIIRRTVRKLNEEKVPMKQSGTSDLENILEKSRREVHLARSVLEPKHLQNLLRNNFEYLRATRSLLIQLRSFETYLLTRLSSVPQQNYDDARSRVHRLFKKEIDPSDLDLTRKKIMDLMFKELVHNIKVYLDYEYNIEANRVDRELKDIDDLAKLKRSLETIISNLFLVRSRREISSIQLKNIIDIWEHNLDSTIRKYMDVYNRWKELEETERRHIHEDPSIADIKDRIASDELHGIIRWMTPRLYEVPKVKNLEKRPTLILINGTAGTGRSTILNRVSNLLSIPTCFNSGIIEKAVLRTLEWLMGTPSNKRQISELFFPSGTSCSLSEFYERSTLTMIGMKGTLNRLIKENSSAVIIGDSLIPSMLEERYYETANLICIVISDPDDGSDHREINNRLRELARSGRIMQIDDVFDGTALEMILSRVTSPYADRGLPVKDDLRHGSILEIEKWREGIASQKIRGFNGAILTDIDDTLIPSGVTPDEDWISSFKGILGCLADSRIIWAPMSGVAMDKLGGRLLYRLPGDVVLDTVAYLGDGSGKYSFDEVSSRWITDPNFLREFSDAQSVAVIGSERFQQVLLGLEGMGYDNDHLEDRIRTAVSDLDHHNLELDDGVVPIDPLRGLVGELEDMLMESGIRGILEQNGSRITAPETYFRGGSVSWMMLGDVSADPYHDPRSTLLRKGDMIPYIERRLKEHRDLRDLGETGINVPFPGARGIKFVLQGNDKERGARDLMETYEVASDSILFIGNELFQGGNDNMLRNIEGITLCSVGDRVDPGAIDLGKGVDKNWSLLQRITGELERGFSFREILRRIRENS